jgi:hypothetical protein
MRWRSWRSPVASFLELGLPDERSGALAIRSLEVREERTSSTRLSKFWASSRIQRAESEIHPLLQNSSRASSAGLW